MKIAYCEYELVGLAPIESKQVHASHKGALLKIQFSEGAIGYADCHPWTELGDLPLEEQLKMLQQGKCTPLLSRSLSFAAVDAYARHAGVSLFQGLDIPNSHYLIANIQEHDIDLSSACSEGFTCLKIKLGRDLPNEMPHLIRLLKQLPSIFKVRLDFNLKLSQKDFESVLEALTPWQTLIEFFEDPFQFDEKAWQKLQRKGIALACDLNSERALQNGDTASVLVLKPAVQDDAPFVSSLGASQKLVVTSYLDHPIGQLAAAYVAGRAHRSLHKQMDICGLLSHRVYAPNAFSEQLTQKGPKFLIPEGSGFGFDSLLANQEWKSL